MEYSGFNASSAQLTVFVVLITTKITVAKNEDYIEVLTTEMNGVNLSRI